MRLLKRMALRTSRHAGLSLMLLAFPFLAMSCSFSPARFFARNACDIFNCDVLFFIDDLFPLSAGPMGGAGEPADEAEEEEGGGHSH